MKPSGKKPVLTPKLRFPEFRDGPAWESKELHKIAEPVSERADNEDENNILTLSGEHGLVLQSEYFGRQIAGTNSERYLKIQRDDFVYNDRTTKASEYGTIKRLTKHPHGIVSPIYKCFRFKSGELPGFWEWYLESGAHEAELRGLANEGARAGRFNVSIDRFLSTSVYAPKRGSNEQQKIAECLSTLDELIGAESQKVDALKAHKKGLMQQLFPREGETLPRLRFSEFQSAPEWSEDKLGSVCELYQPVTLSASELSMTGEYLVYGANGIIGSHDEYNHEDSEVAVTCRGATCGEVTRTQPKSWITGNAMVVKPRDARLSRDFIFHYFKNHGLKSVISGSAQPQITRTGFAPLPVCFPKPDEQHRIATCLSSLDDLIAAQSDRLAALQTHKQGLLQQLFPSPAEADA